jgi:hypothetical protein
MIPAKGTAGVYGAGRLAGSWFAELLVTSTHLAGLVCPLCCCIAAETCTVCGAYLCPGHDVACHVAGDTICEACWGKQG